MSDFADFSLSDSSNTDPFGGGNEFGISPSAGMELGSFGGTGALYGGGGFLNSLLGGGPVQTGQLGGGGMNPGSNPPPQQQSNSLDSLFKLLGLGIGGGGALASLLGGGPKSQTTPKMSGQQIDALSALRGQLGTQTPVAQQMYQQGAGMLQGLGQGQIPAGLTNLVNAAYQPYMQDLGRNAIEASQRAGFALPQDAMQGGPGLRIMGQGLAQLPGQMANTTLNTMFPLINALMGQGQQNISNLAGAFGQIPGGQTQQQQPSMAQRFSGMAPFLSGIGNILNPPQQQQQGGIPVAGQQPY